MSVEVSDGLREGVLEILKSPEAHEAVHIYSDVDNSVSSQHHRLGQGKTQATPRAVGPGGLVFTSPNGTKYALTVSNAGAAVFTAI